VGGHQPLKANVRVIAATHQDLDARVREGTFREDLYHRLNVIRLRLPSLRDRREDIPLLARHFLAKSARDLGVEAKRLTENAMNYLAAQEWPGNVRQLENVCHWLTVMAPARPSTSGTCRPSCAWSGRPQAKPLDGRAAERGGKGADPRRVADHGRPHPGVREDADREGLEHTGGRRIEAATLLGIGRNTITRKIAELGIEEKANGRVAESPAESSAG